METKSHVRLAALWVVPALVVAIVLGGFSIFEFVSEKPRMTLMYLARQYEEERLQSKAAEAYYNLVNYNYTAKPIVQKAIRLNHALGNMQQVVDVISKAYQEEVKNDEEIASMYEEAQQYLKTQEAMGQAVSAVSDQESLEKALNQLYEMHKDDQYDDGLLAFFEYFLSSQHGLDINAVYGYIEAGVKGKPGYYWLLTYYAQCQRMMGDLDDAEKSALKAVEFDQGDFQAWHELAIVYLLKNDLDNAMKAGETSYKLNPYVENCNDLALIYVVAGEDEKYQDMVEFLTSKGETVSAKIENYRQGKTTLKQLYMVTQEVEK